MKYDLEGTGWYLELGTWFVRVVSSSAISLSLYSCTWLWTVYFSHPQNISEQMLPIILLYLSCISQDLLLTCYLSVLFLLIHYLIHSLDTKGWSARYASSIFNLLVTTCWDRILLFHVHSAKTMIKLAMGLQAKLMQEGVKYLLPVWCCPCRGQFLHSLYPWILEPLHTAYTRHNVWWFVFWILDVLFGGEQTTL